MRCPCISIGILVSIFLFSFLGPFFYGVNPYNLHPEALLLPPSLDHLFGTDRLGRDLFARLMYGGRVSLIIGVGSAIIASMLGLIIGITAGFFRGKVDKGFVIPILKQKKAQHIVRTLIKLSHSLGATAIAEGIETKHHYEKLLALKCDEGQGFYFAKPMPFEKLLNFIK